MISANYHHEFKEHFGAAVWRWDQGRLGYFSLDKIRKIAGALEALDGVSLSHEPDPLRAVLEPAVGLPFAPATYRVWRNYARVFKVLGLASQVDGKLVATGVCKSLLRTGDDFVTYDEYLSHIARVFYYPSPVFQGYNTDENQVFPFLALLKYLIANTSSGDPSIGVEEVIALLVGNHVTGQEDLPYYAQLSSKPIQTVGDQARQVREMLIFASQLSYLSWIGGRLYLDPLAFSDLSAEQLNAYLSPVVNVRQEVDELEIQAMFSGIGGEVVSPISRETSNPGDIVFTEGKKVRVSHLRTERNRKVVRFYFENTDNPRLCDVCQVEVAGRYPWLSNLIEVHHILPLASPLHVDREGTSIGDLVGVCPNCHRATHAYYRSHLAEHDLSDFESEEHAKQVYLDVKAAFIVI